MSGYPVISGSAEPGHFFNIQSWPSLGGQGDGIYHLMDAVIDGKPTLVGGHRGDYRLFNLMTGDVLFDFSGVTFYQPPAAAYGAQSPAGYTADAPFSMVDPITNVQMGLGSYDAQCKWYDPVAKKLKYYYGGYIKVYPAGVTVPTTTNDQTYKYSYVVETTDHKTWTVIFLSRNDYAYVGAGDNTTTRWSGECSALLGVPGALYIALGDGHKNLGVYKYIGGGAPICTGGVNQVSQLAAALVPGTAGESVIGMVLADDVVYCKLGGSSALRAIYHKTGAAGSYVSAATVPLRGTGGNYTPVTLNNGNIGALGRMNIIGCPSGIIIGNCADGLNGGAFVPMFITTNTGATMIRGVGWRSAMVSVGGGMVFAVNTSYDGNADLAPSYLCYWVNGVVHIIDTGGSFQAIRVFNGKLYYSCTSLYDNGVTTFYRNMVATLKSIPIGDLGRAKPPVMSESFAMNGYTTSGTGFSGIFAAYPSAGYSRGECLFNSDTAGNLTLMRISAQRANAGQTAGKYEFPVVAVAANTPMTIDMSPYLRSGDVIAAKFSANANISGRITFQP